MKIIAGALIIVFAIMALFSFMGIANMQHGAGECMATIINNGACPETASLLELVTFHTSAFGAFSLAVLTATIMLLLLAVSHLLKEIADFPILSLRLQRITAISKQDFSLSKKELRALARFELSPTR